MKRKFQFSYTLFLLICLTIFHTIGDWRVFGVGVSSLFLLLSPLISVPLIFFNVYLAYKAKIFTTYNAVLTFFNVIYVALHIPANPITHSGFIRSPEGLTRRA